MTEWRHPETVPSLLADVPFPTDVVDSFRRTTQAGVPMVMDTCPAIEWSRG